MKRELYIFPIVLWIILVIFQAISLSSDLLDLVFQTISTVSPTNIPVYRFKDLQIPIWFINGIPLFMCFLMFLTTRKVKHSDKSFIALWVGIIVSLINFAIFLIGFLIESIYFPNYVYSNYGINLSFLKNYNVYLVFFLSLYFFENPKSLLIKRVKQKIGFGKNKNQPFFVAIGFVGFMSVYLYLSSYIFNFSILKQSISLVKNCQSENRCYYIYLYGNIVRDVEPILKIVPEDGYVIVPPQSNEWPDIGNVPLARYFVFPRYLVSYDNYKLVKENNLGNTIYVLKIKKSNYADVGWPEDDYLNKIKEVYPNREDIIFSENYTIIKFSI